MCLQDDPANHTNLEIPAVLPLIATPLHPHVCEARGHKSTVHLAIEDASGDSAVIEFVKGVQKIYHGKQYHIMTNDPAYDEQLKLLEAHSKDFANPRELPRLQTASARRRRESGLAHVRLQTWTRSPVHFHRHSGR